MKKDDQNVKQIEQALRSVTKPTIDDEADTQIKKTLWQTVDKIDHKERRKQFWIKITGVIASSFAILFVTFLLLTNNNSIDYSANQEMMENAKENSNDQSSYEAKNEAPSQGNDEGINHQNGAEEDVADVAPLSFVGSLNEHSTNHVQETISTTMWKEAKNQFDRNNPGNEGDLKNVTVSELQIVEKYEGTLYGSSFQIQIYSVLEDYLYISSNYKEVKAFFIIENKVANPTIFYRESFYVQDHASINIVSGKFTHSPGEIVLIANEWLQLTDKPSVGSPFTLNDTQLKVISENGLIIQ